MPENLNYLAYVDGNVLYWTSEKSVEAYEMYENAHS